MRRSLLLDLPPPHGAEELRLGLVDEPRWRALLDWTGLVAALLLLLLGLSS